jgi:hypothetical protein
MTPLDSLKKAPERLNAAIEMNRKLADAQPIDPKKLLLMANEIEKAINSGSDEIRRVSQSFAALKTSDAIPSATVPEGF